MRNKVRYSTRGHRADIGSIEIHRLVSNNYVNHVGHFIFLDYIPPFMMAQRHINPDAAHPHRGIATITYLLHGEADHFDSRGHQGTVHSGGVQWMKAGNGIIHNEAIGPDSKTGGKFIHGFQFWMNLTASEKQKDPQYMALQDDELPKWRLDNNAGILKVVVGEFKGNRSRIPLYTKQLLYHIRLHANRSFVLSTERNLEYAAFLPENNLSVNGQDYHHGDLIGFEDHGGEIAFHNPTDYEVEFIVFGGEKFTEPFVAHGPFVMSTREEIKIAHNDYVLGKYGEIKYN